MKSFLLLLFLVGLGGCVARVDGRFVRLRAEVVAPAGTPVAAVYPRWGGAAGDMDPVGRFGPAWRAVRVHPGRNFN